MKIKHKVIKEFQFLSDDKKIFILKVGTVLDEYNYKVKNESIPIDKAIIDNNPDFFETIDWRSELTLYLKSIKLAQPAQVSRKIAPFIEDMILSSMAKPDGDDKSLEIIQKESELSRRESIIENRESDLDVRTNMLENRELSYTESLKSLYLKEKMINSTQTQISSREAEVQKSLQDINEKERELSNKIVNSTNNINEQLATLRDKVNKDIEEVTRRENEVEKKEVDLQLRENILSRKIIDVNQKISNYELDVEKHTLWIDEIQKLDNEIKRWEEQHWKLQRNNPPPSAIKPTE